MPARCAIIKSVIFTRKWRLVFVAFVVLRQTMLLRKIIHNSPKKGRLSQTKALVIMMTRLITRRLVLKPLDLSCSDSFCAYAADPENARMMMFLPYESREECLQVIQNAMEQWNSPQPEMLDFALFAGEEHIGGLTLYFLEDRSEGELGWIIRRDRWGMGYAAEAASAVIDYARTLGIRRIIACCDSENAPSRRVMEKLGMTFVSCSPGRKNRSSDEERLELLYEIAL